MSFVNGRTIIKNKSTVVEEEKGEIWANNLQGVKAINNWMFAQLD